MSSLIVATDGSSLGNPGPSAWAYYVDAGCWAAGGFARATNNVAELTAVQQLLLAAPGDVDLEIHADSQYVIDALAGRNGKRPWVAGWRARGWKTAAGAPVANRELIEPIDALLRSRPGRTVFVWVRAHQRTGGDPWNEAADARAQEAAQAVRAGRAVPTGPGWR